MKIAILIPAHNEQNAIASVVRSFQAKGLDVFVFDDGSTDQTSLNAREAGAVVLRHEQKSGKGATLRRGFQYISSHDYDGVIIVDGDGQHSADDVDRFIALANQNPDCLINGNRMTNHDAMPWLRFLTNRFMSLLISAACGQWIPDTQCGYRYIGVHILRAWNLQCTGFEIETEMLMKAAKKKFKIYSVPIKTIYEDEKSKINPFRDTVRFIRYFVKEIFT